MWNLVNKLETLFFVQMLIQVFILLVTPAASETLWALSIRSELDKLGK